MPKYLIVGGAGFIGVNAAHRYAGEGHRVTVLDDFSRPGAHLNVESLLAERADVQIIEADIRTDQETLADAAADCDVLLHFAAQVAVTTSVLDPRRDFDINALGTFNVLEAARHAPTPPIVLFASTNKVYGGMTDTEVIASNGRYEYADLPHGVSESWPLDFHSPYGCSKGAADQYVRDYARIYGLRSVVFRQSCIYGPRQFGVEDQGWIAWFALRSLLGLPVTIYGDGMQVRDVLFVDDLLDAFDAAVERIAKVAGGVYNVGGGPASTLSLLELIQMLEEISGRELQHSFDDWRPGDQKVFVSDVRRAERDLNWRPRTAPRDGIEGMRAWMVAHQDAIVDVYDDVKPSVEGATHG